MLRYALPSMCLVAGLAGMSDQAHAAPPVEYVRVCDQYGSGFFYIPGTETCLKIEGGVDVGFTNSSVALGNTFARTGGATDSSHFTESDTAARLGLDVRAYVPFRNLRAFAGGWTAPTLGGAQEFEYSILYAPGDIAQMRVEFTPNLFTGYVGFETDLGKIGNGDLSGAVYGGARFVKAEFSLSGQAVNDFSASRSVTRAVPVVGAELTYRPADKGFFGHGCFGRLGIQYQGGLEETLSASTPWADITSTFEVEDAWHVYFQVGRVLF